MNWSNHWSDKNIIKNKSDQKQIGRTLKGKEITKTNWVKTVDDILKTIKINKNHLVLDLCCGNGLLTKEFALKCKKVYAVDYSEPLLKNFVTDLPNIKKIKSDILKLKINKIKFDIIIIYFSIQHFSDKESIEIIRKSIKYLNSGGVIYIGDIPNIEKKWDWYSNKKYRRAYVDSLVNNDPIIGNWYSKKFFVATGEYFNMKKTKIIKQKSYMINHKIRFDVLYEKK